MRCTARDLRTGKGDLHGITAGLPGPGCRRHGADCGRGRPGIEKKRQTEKRSKLKRRAGQSIVKRLDLAIIGQGRSGKNIHGAFYRSDANRSFNVRYVVDADAVSRERAKELYPGCETLADYRLLFEKKGVDLVVNASYSDMHYSVTKDLLRHGLNVLVEKPFARNRWECEDLIRTAGENGVLLAVFQQTFLAPFYLKAKSVADSGLLGRIEQINIRYSGYARRWDWQTTQKRMGGSTYNTGPHPIGLALGFLDFDPLAKVVYSRLDTAITSGDAEDYSKILITAPGKPLVDIEMSAVDPYSTHNLQITGTRGALRATTSKYELKYWVEDENPPRPVVHETLRNADHEPVYCGEKLIWHEESGEFTGTAFTTAVYAFYENLYRALTEKAPLAVPPEKVADIIGVIEKVHADNPLPVRF